MLEQKEIQKLLSERLTEGRLRNSAYSIRALAQKLGISASALSEILNGKRRVSNKLAKRFANKLCLSPEETDRLLGLFPKKRGYDTVKTEKSREMLQLNMDHFKIISDWYHFAILSLSETADFRTDPAWIAGRLNIKAKEAAAALERLERLEMLERNEKGELVPTGVAYTTSDDIANLSLRKSHAQNLELARTSLEKDPVEERDFTAMTMAIDPEKLPEAKKMIREFRNKLCTFLESGTKKEVYKLCIQTIPLTKTVPTGTKPGVMK